jgi:hypothetical protein
LVKKLKSGAFIGQTRTRTEGTGDPYLRYIKFIYFDPQKKL